MSNRPIYSLYRWYDSHKRDLPWRDTDDAYHIWLSEIILQQTRVAQGMMYYLRFIEAYPTVADLADADEDRVLRLWQGLGYYTRARNLHRAARLIVSDNESAGRDRAAFPRTYDELRRLPGVGDYTAGAIAAFAYDLPYPALDGNVYRVLSRFYDCEIPFDTSAGKRHFHALAEQLLDRENPRLFDSAIMELGALHCVPRDPDCDSCPLREDCLAHAHGTVNLLPVRKERTKVQERTIDYTFYLTPDRRTLIHQRGEGDIWTHLWELVPEAAEGAPTRTYTHILSHQKIRARFWLKLVEQLPNRADTRSVSLSDLDNYAFSRLTLRFLNDTLPKSLNP